MAESKPSKKKPKSIQEMRRELQALAKPGSSVAKPPPNLKKVLIRTGVVVAVAWVIVIIIHHWIATLVAGVLTVAAAVAGLWFFRYMKRQQAIGSLLQGASTEEERKEALKKLETDFGKGDVQARIARAQLEMQDNPRKALETLASIELGKQLRPVADQVRALRAMLHLQFGETADARGLADQLELGKQQEPKTRAMFATVASEAWARTGAAKKAVETLELFNPEDPEFAEMRVQMWRARAFAYAGVSDMKGVTRALRKLAEMSPQLLGMFIGQKKIHPLLEQEAKQALMKSGAMPRKMVRQKM